MKLIVACPLWLLLVDSDTHEIFVIENGRREYYGISWNRQSELCLSHSNLDNGQVMGLEDYINAEVGGVSLGGRDRFQCLAVPHQLVCRDELILATNTGRNCLTVFKQDDLFYHHSWLNSVRWDRLGRERKVGQHFNSVTFNGDRLFVLAHNLECNSFIYELTWPRLEIVRRIDTTAAWAHNIWLRDGKQSESNEQIIVCDSRNRSLLDVGKNSILWQSPDASVVTRGLACGQGKLFVGISQLSDRPGRHTTDGAIVVLDSVTFKELDRIDIPFSGDVHEIRLLDVPDQCHHGIGFNGSVLVSEQASAQFLNLPSQMKDPTLQSSWMLPYGQATWQADGRINLEDQEMNLALMRAWKMDDGKIVVTNPHIEPGAERQISLVARYLGPGEQNMYLGTLYQHGSSAAAHIWKNVAGKWTRLTQIDLTQRVSTMRFEVIGSDLKLHLDDVCLHAVDNSLPGAGKVGLRGTKGTVGSFMTENFK